MLKILKKYQIAIISLMLVLICGITYCVTNYIQSKQIATTTQAITRTIEVKKNEIDYQSIFGEFENSVLKTEGTLTTFEGYKSINFEELGVDFVSDANIEKEVGVKYNFSFDNETNVVTLSAELKNELGEIQIDTIAGTAFINEYGEIDALMDMDGDYALLSEMQSAGMIENCGWFSKLFKKIVIAVVVVVAVAAVAAVVVATAGAGLGACIAAGAIAGGITGGVAGGLISYSEYGKLDWKWIVGGAVIGAALGAAVGWGVGSAMGVGTTAKTAGYLSKDFNFSNTVLNHTDRPFRASQLLAKEIMQSGSPIVDNTISGGLKWTVAGSFNGTLGTWELVYDVAKNIVVHFLFKG